MNVVLRMTLDQFCQTIHDRHERRKRRAEKLPIGMALQLFPAFVRFIQRIEKRHRISHVDHHGPIEFRRRLPDGIEPRIVDLHQFAMMIAHVQSERLPDLQTLRAPLRLLAQTLRRPLRKPIALLGPCVPIHAAKDGEAIGRGLLEMIEMFLKQFFAPPAVEIDVLRHAGFIERRETFVQWALIPTAAEGFSEMIVPIDHRKARLHNRGGFGNKRGFGTKVLKKHA